MAKKSYIGCCGSCSYCNLADSYYFLYSTSFKCTRYDRWVKADEKACSKLEPDRKRSNELIEKYDR